VLTSRAGAVLPSRAGAVLIAVLMMAVVTSCGGTSPGSPTTDATSSASAPTGVVTIKITLAGGQVTPNGEKYDVVMGQTVVLEVTSDHDDEIHVHSEPEVELEVKAGVAVRTHFVAQQRGSFEVERTTPRRSSRS